MKLELNEEQLNLLKDAMSVYARATKEELAMWQRRGAEECIKSTERDIEVIREIEDMLY